MGRTRLRRSVGCAGRNSAAGGMSRRGWSRRELKLPPFYSQQCGRPWRGYVADGYRDGAEQGQSARRRRESRRLTCQFAARYAQW